MPNQNHNPSVKNGWRKPFVDQAADALSSINDKITNLDQDRSDSGETYVGATVFKRFGGKQRY